MAGLHDVPAVWEGILGYAELTGEELLRLTDHELSGYSFAKERKAPGL